jgi:hypothetical protein
MGWASWTAVFRMLMPRGGDKATGVEEDEDLSDPSGDVEYPVFLNESDETIALDEAFLASVRLPKHGRTWALDGLTALSREAAQTLAQHEGELWLTSLTTLSDEAAKSLAQHKGSLFLTGLTSLSDEAAQALRANPEILLPEKFR